MHLVGILYTRTIYLLSIVYVLWRRTTTDTIYCSRCVGRTQELLSFAPCLTGLKGSLQLVTFSVIPTYVGMTRVTSGLSDCYAKWRLCWKWHFVQERTVLLCTVARRPCGVHSLWKVRFVQSADLFAFLVESSWNVMAHGNPREGKWKGDWWMERVARTLHTTSELGVSSITTAMRTPRLPVVDWTDVPANLTL